MYICFIPVKLSVTVALCLFCGHGSQVVKDRGWLVTSSSPVLLKTRRVGEQCTLNLLGAQKSSRDGAARSWGVSLDIDLVTSA
ncbi:hypothetical protein TNCV_4507231 [Trichonephila clavipes]|nr:hypothetical protein TNCV_4507231 [Trichonephila clavipes]